MSYYFYDTEVFPNYFLVEIYDPESGTFQEFEFFGSPEKVHDRTALIAAFQKNVTFVGFNSNHYDNIVLHEFFNVGTIQAAKTISDKIITGEIKRAEKLTQSNIDVLGVLDRKGGLKIYECRLGLSKVIESSHDFTKPIESKDLGEIKTYCQHDVKSTCALFHTKLAQEKLAVKQAASKEFGLDLESLTEAEIASRIMDRELISKTKLPKNVLKMPCFVFKGSEIINPAITFQTSAFQACLHAAKNHNFVYSSKEKRAFSYDLPCQSLTLHLANGGLHSIGKKAAITGLSGGESILDYDVTSFYPASILIESIAPSRAKSEFLAFYKELVNCRIQAKRRGEKTKADTYKIILNATYGKFGDQYSLLYNPKNLLSVTLTCQFRILTLIERVASVANVDLLQANTDGVTLFCKTAEARKTIENIAENWKKETGYNLEKSEYSKIVMADVNNYVAISTDGKKKEKGSFQTTRNLFGGGTEALIVPQAIAAYFFEGIDPETFIPAHKDDLELFVLFRKRDKAVSDSIACNPKVNRFVYSKTAQNVLKGQYANGKEIKVAANIQLANDYDKVDISDIDLDRYVAEAKKRIADIKGEKEPSKKRAKKSTKKGSSTPLFDAVDNDVTGDNVTVKKDTLQDISPSAKTNDTLKAANILFDSGAYHIAHAGTKDSLNIVSNREFFTYPDVPNIGKLSWVQLNPSELDCKSHASQYVLFRQAVTIEYDNLSIDEQYKKFANIPHSVLCFSGGKSIHCHIRFTRPLSEDEDRSLIAYLKALFPTSDKNVFGLAHFVRIPGGHNYDTGKEQAILSVQSRIDPDAFFAWLEDERKKAGVEIQTEDAIKSESNPVKFAYLEWLLDRELKEKLGYLKRKGEWPNGKLPGYYYISHCPDAKNHTDAKSSASEFAIFLSDGGEIRKKCQHAHCSDIWQKSLRQLVEVNIFDHVNFRLFANTQDYSDLGLGFADFCTAIKGESERPEVKKIGLAEDATETTETTELTTAFKQPGHIWIIAPPASGKSREAGRMEALAVEQKTPFCYVANNRSDLGDYRDKTALSTVYELIGGKKIADENTDEKESATKGRKLDQYDFIDTHKTYISRKGDGPLFYPLFNWLFTKKNEGRPVTLVIDEVNEFVSGLDRFVPIETTMIGRKYNGDKRKWFARYVKCPAFESKSYRCHLCEKCRNVVLENDKSGDNSVIRVKSGYEDEIKDVPINFNIERSVSVPEVNFDIHYIKQDANYLARRNEYYKSVFDDEEYFELSHLDDLINSSFVPAILEFYPTLNGVRWEHTEDATEDEKAKVVFPSRACGRWLNVLDLAGLDAIKKACKDVKFLSTNISRQTKDVLEVVFPDLEIKTVQKATAKQEKIVVIGFGKSLTASAFSVLSGCEKNILHFEPTNHDATRFFDSLPDDCLAGLDLGDGLIPKEKKSLKAKNIMVANSFGCLGKAVRLTEYDAVIVNPCNEPRFKKYRYQTKAEIVAAIQEYQWELMEQNSGRILGSAAGVKYFVFPKISEAGFSLLLEKLHLGDIAETFVTRYLEEDENLLYRILLGTAPLNEAETKKEKKVRAMDISKKQRALSKEDIEKEKAANKEGRTAAKIEACKNEIAANRKNYDSWETFRTKNHVGRFEQKDRENLKNLFLGLSE